MLCRDHHKSNVLVDVKVDVLVGSETLDYSSGVLQTAPADEPPGRFRSEEDGGDEDDGPDPSRLKKALVVVWMKMKMELIYWTANGIL